MYHHVSVLLNETIEGLNIKEDGLYVDCTLGGGGHSSEILKQLTTGHLYCFDQDKEAIDEANKKLEKINNRYTIIYSNFKYLKEELNKRGVYKVDGILFDLGVSSPQLDEGERGFSYKYDAPLDMRMDTSQKLTAYDVVNSYSYNDLVTIFYQYGEEKYAKSIARAIERERSSKPIETTLELVDIIKSAIPAKAKRKSHPAKKCFQAIRIAVNDELNVLEYALNDALDLLSVGGRIAVISFHSLEDRIVKQAFKKASSETELPPSLPVKYEDIKPQYQLVNKKPIVAGEQELKENYRSHSAKLRIIERICGEYEEKEKGIRIL